MRWELETQITPLDFLDHDSSQDLSLSSLEVHSTIAIFDKLSEITDFGPFLAF